MGNGSLLDNVSCRQDFTMKTPNGQISARCVCHGYNCLTLQGAPETGDIPGAMHKPSTIEVKAESLEYAPTGGTKVIDLSAIVLMAQELRIAVADLYNHLYREDKESKYTWEVRYDRSGA